MTNLIASEKIMVQMHFPVAVVRKQPWLAFTFAWFFVLSSASWGKLGDLIVDIGHEVEIPARLASGQLLYQDIQTNYGPLAYYFNAFALTLFGHHLEVLYAVGLCLALATTLLVYWLTAQLTNPKWAALCTVCVQLYCAFSPGLFNFILPYCYGAVYGTVFCLLAASALDRYAQFGKMSWLVVAGVCCGLAGLSKQEYGVAALGGVLVGVSLCSHDLLSRVMRSALVVLTACVCILLPLILLSQQVSWEVIYSSLLPTNKLGLLSRGYNFQVSPIKTLTLSWASFKIFLPSFLVVLGVVALVNSLSKLKWVSSNTQLELLIRFLAGITFSFACLFLLKKLALQLKSTSGFDIESLIVFDNHPLSYLHWVIPVLVIWFALNQSKLAGYKHAALLWTLLVCTLLLNARWLFYIDFYGLYATPAIILFFAILYRLSLNTKLPVWTSLLVCLLIGGVLRVVHFGQYVHAVSTSQGTLYTRDDALARAFNQTVNAIKASGATSVLVVPEGSVINFLTATRSPGRETAFYPGVLPTSGDELDFLSRIRADPPELIVYVDRAFLNWPEQTYAEFNPIVDNWITNKHRLIYKFSKREGFIRIYSDF